MLKNNSIQYKYLPALWGVIINSVKNGTYQQWLDDETDDSLNTSMYYLPVLPTDKTEDIIKSVKRISDEQFGKGKWKFECHLGILSPNCKFYPPEELRKEFTLKLKIHYKIWLLKDHQEIIIDNTRYLSGYLSGYNLEGQASWGLPFYFFNESHNRFSQEDQVIIPFETLNRWAEKKPAAVSQFEHTIKNYAKSQALHLFRPESNAEMLDKAEKILKDQISRMKI